MLSLQLLFNNVCCKFNNKQTNIVHVSLQNGIIAASTDEILLES